MTGPQRTLERKTCLVTGSTSGLGEVTARELARKGATVFIVAAIRRRPRLWRKILRRVRATNR